MMLGQHVDVYCMEYMYISMCVCVCCSVLQSTGRRGGQCAPTPRAAATHQNNCKTLQHAAHFCIVLLQLIPTMQHTVYTLRINALCCYNTLQPQHKTFNTLLLKRCAPTPRVAAIIRTHSHTHANIHTYSNSFGRGRRALQPRAIATYTHSKQKISLICTGGHIHICIYTKTFIWKSRLYMFNIILSLISHADSLTRRHSPGKTSCTNIHTHRIIIRICTYIYICIHVYICKCIHMYIYICIYIHTLTHICIYM